MKTRHHRKHRKIAKQIFLYVRIMAITHVCFFSAWFFLEMLQLILAMLSGGRTHA